MHRRAAIAVTATTLAAFTACASTFTVHSAEWQSRQVPVELPAEPPRELEVQFFCGMLVLEPGPALSCDLRVDLTAATPEILELCSKNLRAELDAGPDHRATLSVPLPSGAPLHAITTFYRLQAPANLKVTAVTSCGTVIARGFQGDLDVRGGSGNLDVQLDGGRADLRSTSGCIRLRGAYQIATIESRLGRIDVQMPVSAQLALDLEIRSGIGDVFLDLQSGERLDVRYRGELLAVRSDAGVRVEWDRVGVDEYHIGRIGEMDGLPAGRVVLASEGRVNVRQAPSASSP